MPRFLAAATVLLAACSTIARADVKLPAIFSDHMVLQQDMPLKFWGVADAGEEITVTVRDARQAITADNQGKWRVELPGIAATQDRLEVVIAGKNTITIRDVIIGEVWVASGQSNMEWALEDAAGGKETRDAANYDDVRLFDVDRRARTNTQDDVGGKWVVCEPEAAGKFSAVAFYFGLELRAKLGRPVGLIDASWGGTPAEAWTTSDALREQPTLRPMLEKFEKQLADRSEAEAKEDKPPKEFEALRNAPTALWNGMVNGIAGYPIRGVIWYQGESNATRAFQYRTLMPTMIQSWRDAWGQQEFPFIQVQLAGYKEAQTEAGEAQDWPELREAQYLTTKALPNVGLATAIDLGEENDIHPRNKADVGKRLARVALQDYYKVEGVVGHGPEFDALKVDGERAVLSFKYADGLELKPGKLSGFAICSADKQWKWGEATIEGKTVVVTHADIAKPVAVRYAWGMFPPTPLCNAAGLPALPFRTDDFPMVTGDAK